MSDGVLDGGSRLPRTPGLIRRTPRAIRRAPGATVTVEGLPEQASVHWRPRMTEVLLRRSGRRWTTTTVCAWIPFVLAAGMLVAFRPILAFVSVVLLLHAWAIPELYAARGAGVLRPRPARDAGPERRAMLLLGDLVTDENRRLYAETGLVVEPGRFGAWVVGEAGALLVRTGGRGFRWRRVTCFCVRATGDELPAGDRVAHLLLALRCDEAGFATVANQAFSGAAWRVRRRMRREQRLALDAARVAARDAHR